MTKKYAERWDAGCDSRPLLEEADREIERLRKALRAKTVASIEIRANDGTLLHGFGSQPAPEPGARSDHCSCGCHQTGRLCMECCDGG